MIENLHDKYIIHRKINPNSFHINCDLNNTGNRLYLNHFDLCKEFMSGSSHHHIPFSVNQLLIGIPQYNSINAHQYKELSRRDDLESFGNVLVYIHNGILPWQNIHSFHSIKHLYQMVSECKSQIITNNYRMSSRVI